MPGRESRNPSLLPLRQKMLEHAKKKLTLRIPWQKLKLLLKIHVPAMLLLAICHVSRILIIIGIELFVLGVDTVKNGHGFVVVIIAETGIAYYA